MKKALIIAAVMMLAFISPAFSAEEAKTETTSGSSFEQKQADQIRKLDERMANIQGEKACVQAATDIVTLKECRKKFKSERAKNRPAKQ